MAEIYERIISFENLIRSFYRCYKGRKKRREDAIKFYMNLEGEIERLRQELKDKTYRPGRYRYFKIYDPKERVIAVAQFRDRVVHHAVVDVLEEIYLPYFYEHSYACIKGRGSHRAVLKAKEYIKENEWYLKMDIKSYYDTIPHDGLKRVLRERIEDEDVMWLVGRILEVSEESSGITGAGIPIGNLTSQFFGNVYLDKLDWYIVKELGVKYYIRYMDDMVLFSNSKEDLKRWRDLIRSYVEDELSLRLKDKAVYIQKRENGLGFLGYRVYPNLIRVRNRNIKRFKKKMRMRLDEYYRGKITARKVIQSVQSLLGYMRFADTGNLLRSIVWGEEL